MGKTYCGPNGSQHSNKGSKRNNIVVNEIYGPVKQGEGKSAGKEVMFIRTAGCNLACIWCFVGNTWVATPTGKRKIKDIKIGDIVLSSNEKVILPKKVTKIFTREVTPDQLIKIQTEKDTENSRVFCTSNHEFFTNKGWKQAINLQIGDEIEYIDTIKYCMKTRNPRKYLNGEKWQKAKEKMRGRKRTLNQRINIRNAKLGSKNPRYTGKRGEDLPGRFMLWDRIRKDILERDNNECQNCHSKERLEIHHIIPYRISCSNDFSNLITLCKKCHLKAEKQWLHNGKKVIAVTGISTKQAARFNGNAKKIKVYNLEVEDFHTYFANTLMVHNCDTPYTWNWKGTKFQHPDKFDPKKEMHDMSSEEVLAMLREKGPNVKAIVISGGEPMLQQNRLIELVQTLKQDNYWIEIETNGTIKPSKEFLESIDQINCSPKLSNSGPDNPEEKRIKDDALNELASSNKTTFKFVISRDEDISEIKQMVEKYHMKEIYVMPEGKTKEEQLARQEQVQQLAEENNWHFSPRLHVLQFGNKRGV